MKNSGYLRLLSSGLGLSLALAHFSFADPTPTPSTLQDLPQAPNSPSRLQSAPAPLRIHIGPAAAAETGPASAPSGPRRGLSPEDLAVLRSLRFHGKSLSQMKILFVDDNGTIQKLAGRQFPLKLGINPANMSSAVNGELAVAAVRSAHQEGKPYDLILMDEQMPGKDGITATKEIRQLEHTLKALAPDAHFEHVHIVANSNSEPREAIRQRFMDAGATGYCFKDTLNDEYFQRMFTALKEIADHIPSHDSSSSAAAAQQ
jgi:CheY-like chemotaxis protein